MLLALPLRWDKPISPNLLKLYGLRGLSAHCDLSPFTWSEDDKHLISVEFYKEQNHFVHIDLGEGVMNPVVLRKRIDIDALIRKEAISKKQRDESKQFPYKLVVKEIHWKDKDRVDIRPYYREVSL